MIKIHHVNLFAVGLPIIFVLLGIFFKELIFFGLLSTMLTGLIQVILGIILFFNDPKDNPIKIYLGSVIVYFLLLFIVSNSFQNLGDFTIIFVLIPAILAIYLTIIILKKLKS